MRDHRPQSNFELIETFSEDIRTKARFLASLNEEIHYILPDSEYVCRVANYRSGILVIECASACWAMRLNYARQLLLSSLRSNRLASLTTIEVKINPSLMKAETKEHGTCAPNTAPISKQGANFLLSLANNTSEKIASRLRKIAELAE